MSILVAAAGNDAAVGWVFPVLLATACAAAGVIAVRAGLFRPGSLADFPRIPADRPMWPLVLATCGGVLIWLTTTPVLFAGFRELTGRPVQAGQAIEFTLADLVFLGWVGPGVGFALLVLADQFVYRVVGQRFGAGVKELPRGAAGGLAGAIAVVPFVFVAGIVMDWVYRLIQYEHPAEHALLKAIGDSPSPALRGLAVLAAVVAAPVWEEVLFRGHLQTLLRGGMVWKRAGWGAWLAIVLTSVAFAFVHPVWTWPMIFVLSLGLGWAYERTNNLWVPIVMHALFNALNTAIFLLAHGGRLN